MDCCITWNYIVNTMKEKFGISIDSDEKFSMREIEAYLEDIWDEYVDKKYKEEMGGNDDSQK